ncbi:hypothetical protein H5410_064338 [Solanum commersonii]|uniref:NB-ARC domain-containing protein n=1 Tax=Solanum commersonii TaxID=4109 RepID=A0A9J5VZK4_SOLCO|nr:hypothetical protein H5410_064338 [Solanum commersonii]
MADASVSFAVQKLEYNTMDLLKTIIKSIQGCVKETLDLLEKMAEMDLGIYLQAWESLKRAFPDSKNGSRVIITTRKEDVAERAGDRGFAHKLRFLSQEESWDLFCSKLLDVRVMDMVEKCRGLPLAIVVLSGLLSHKKGLNEWQKVKDYLWKNIIEDKSIEISNILSLSYSDLSIVLKWCFLYFGIFPEDQVLETENIIWLWMAEGFIPRGKERMEDVAEGFLNELTRRSLVQVAKTFWEKVTKCRALEVNFFDGYDPRSHFISSLCIRHVIHSQGERYLSLDLSTLKLRKIMFFDLDFRNMSLKNFTSVFKHLYVLYLEMRVDNMFFVLVPNAIGSLYHLKFLRLKGRIDDLPTSIGNLKNLQTLVINEGIYSCELPRETADLINLRHLVASFSKPLKRISKLTSLQVLKGVHCDQWKDVDPVDLLNLRELSMRYINKSFSLRNLDLFRAYEGKEIMCSDNNSFSQLEYLTLYDLRKLEK